MKRKAQRGFTLMELLIAMTLLGMLAAGILVALRVSVNAMDKADKRLMSNRKVAAVERILEQQVAGLMPVRAECMGGGEGPAARVAFFQGEPQSMRFVSSYSIQEGARGYARILEYQVVPGERGEGVRLVVNELLYSGPRSTGMLCRGVAPGPDGAPVTQFVPVQASPGSFVLADRLAYCRFSFREQLVDPPITRWLTEWKKALLPNAVRIEMAPLEPDAAKLQWLTLTMPVHVTREPLGQYAN